MPVAEGADEILCREYIEIVVSRKERDESIGNAQLGQRSVYVGYLVVVVRSVAVRY